MRKMPVNRSDSFAELKAQYDFMASCHWRVKSDATASWCILVYRGCDNETVPSEWMNFNYCPNCGKILKINEEGETK